MRRKILCPVSVFLYVTEALYENTKRKRRAEKQRTISPCYNKFYMKVKIIRDCLNRQNNFIDKKLKCGQVDYNTENISVGPEKNTAFLWVCFKGDMVSIFWKALKVYNKKLERNLVA